MFQISFDFDEKTKSISNIKVNQITNSPLSADTVASVRLDNAKLILSSKLVADLNINVGDRIAINYVQDKDSLDMYPVIGKAETFSNNNAGNKLTRTNTISFRGVQNTMLSTYGKLFITEPYKDNIYKLVPVNESKLQELNNKNSMFNLNQFDVKYE